MAINAIQHNVAKFRRCIAPLFCILLMLIIAPSVAVSDTHCSSDCGNRGFVYFHCSNTNPSSSYPGYSWSMSAVSCANGQWCWCANQNSGGSGSSGKSDYQYCTYSSECSSNWCSHNICCPSGRCGAVADGYNTCRAAGTTALSNGVRYKCTNGVWVVDSGTSTYRDGFWCLAGNTGYCTRRNIDSQGNLLDCWASHTTYCSSGTTCSTNAQACVSSGGSGGNIQDGFFCFDNDPSRYCARAYVDSWGNPTGCVSGYTYSCVSGTVCDQAARMCVSSGGGACSIEISTQRIQYCRNDPFDMTLTFYRNGALADYASGTLEVTNADRSSLNPNAFTRTGIGRYRYDLAINYGEPGTRTFTATATIGGCTARAQHNVQVFETGDSRCQGGTTPGAQCAFTACNQANSDGCSCGTNRFTGSGSNWCCSTFDGGAGGVYRTQADCNAACGGVSPPVDCQIDCTNAQRRIADMQPNSCTVTCDGRTLTCNAACTRNGDIYTCTEARCQGGTPTTCGTCTTNTNCQCGTNSRTNTANPFCCPTANNGVGGIYTTQAACNTACQGGGGTTITVNCPATCQKGTRCSCTISGCSSGLVVATPMGGGNPMDMAELVLGGRLTEIINSITSNPFTHTFSTNPNGQGTIRVVGVCFDANNMGAGNAIVTVP